jgi:DNA-binding MarR family transcriptional regulator
MDMDLTPQAQALQRTGTLGQRCRSVKIRPGLAPRAGKTKKKKTTVTRSIRFEDGLRDVAFMGKYVNMADIKIGANPLFLREEELRQGMELLFFAYRDFIAEPDKILAGYGYGRAHHRVIYFVGRHPAITVSELLAILQITKQSLSRVLGQLVRDGLIVQRQGLRDRRQRLLELTEAGRDLERRLSEDQRARIARAYRDAGAEAVEGHRTVLRNPVLPLTSKRSG